jgi:heme/copper-type cytochrome/quinol oxidase subunit 2
LVIISIFVFWFFFNILIDFNETTAAVTPTEIARQAISYKHTSRIVHRGTLEVVWTIIPVLILTFIAVPSFELLYALDLMGDPLLTVKCIGSQWYWTYEGMYHHIYDEKEVANLKQIQINLLDWQRRKSIDLFLNWYIPCKYRIKRVLTIGDLYFKRVYRPRKRARLLKEAMSGDNFIMIFRYSHHIRLWTYFKYQGERYNLDLERPYNFGGDSYMLDADELAVGSYRLLETDGYLTLPTDSEIRFVITATDVLHSFAIPALGIKLDAVPGRLNQFGMKVRVPGVYFGQCSELCGVGHGFMPIKVKFHCWQGHMY